MKGFLLTIFILLSLCVLAQPIPPRPNPPRLVNDLTAASGGDGLITREQRDYLERKLVAYDDSTSNQITIVIAKTLGGYEPAVYATELGEQWGVGGKENDNGVVILISNPDAGSDERRKAFIAIGRGLEGKIPDMTAGRIYDEVLVPGLKSGDYYGALDRTVDALFQAAAGEYKAPAGYRNRGSSGGLSVGKIIIAIIVLIVLFSMFGGRGNRGGGYMSRRGYRGFGAPMIFPTGGWGGGSGGWSGGGGGGGGFGGFGGGSFGGGGAGGDW